MKIINKLMVALISTVLLLSCQGGRDKQIDSTEINQETDDVHQGMEVANKFINAYVANCNKMEKSVSTLHWILSRRDATDEFKMAAKKLFDDAEAKNPGLGLGFDPIFNAQDYPVQGFIIESGDPERIIAKEKGIGKFFVPMSIKKVGDAWMVQMCGIINPTLILEE